LARAGGAAVLTLIAGGAVQAQAPCPPRSPWHIDNCATIPAGTMPTPNGTYVRLWQREQVTGGQADNFVIYRHEWYMGGQFPGPYGLYHLQEMAKRLPHVPFTVVIQADVNPQLNEVRAATVVQMLTHYGVEDAAQRVVVAFPAAEGLDGLEAARAYFRSVSTGGVGGGGAGVGVGGGGFGGGGAFGGVGGSLGISSRGY